jgi:hypothetical protein
MGIKKTTITITVLYEDDVNVENMPLSAVLRQMDNGDLIGHIGSRKTISIPDSKVKKELLAVGNDGTFFASEVN